MPEQTGAEDPSGLAAVVADLRRQAEGYCAAELNLAEMRGQRRGESAVVTQKRREAHAQRAQRIAHRHAGLLRDVARSVEKCAKLRATAQGEGATLMEEQMRGLAVRVAAEMTRMESRKQELELLATQETQGLPAPAQTGALSVTTDELKELSGAVETLVPTPEADELQ